MSIADVENQLLTGDEIAFIIFDHDLGKNQLTGHDIAKLLMEKDMFCKRLAEILSDTVPPFVATCPIGAGDGYLVFLLLFLFGYGVVYAILTAVWLVSIPICWINK
jgi:hypothetical protein